MLESSPLDYICQPHIDNKFTVIILTNLSGFGEIDTMAHHIASLYDSRLAPQEKKP